MIPDLIGVMGDVHGNTAWTVSQLPDICKRLSPPRIILQCGDFGVWAPPGIEKWSFAGKEHSRQSFLSAVDEELYAQDAELRFVEGNHENHPLLAKMTKGLEGLDMFQVTPRITWLRRGARWTWHDRTWLACGGAASIDKLLLTEGKNWFPEEEITGPEEFFISAGGPADVLVSHDAPTDCPLHLSPPSSPAWLKRIPACEAHRDRLQRICVAVKPSYVFHGHYHRPQIRTIHAVWGKCRFTTLDCDGTQGNWGILDTRTMEWEW